MRQVVLDTETTGLSPQQGHKLTEIGCVEIINRKVTGNVYQTHINPERELDERAAQITGLSYDFLKDKPKFADVAADFIEFIKDAELIIHNASFDLGFLEHEFNLLKHPYCKVIRDQDLIDTLVMARTMHPGQRNSLDALCKRYDIDNSHRNYHGALLDSEILARVYLAMTAGQTSLDLEHAANANTEKVDVVTKEAKTDKQYNLQVIYASEQEQAEHAAMLSLIEEQQKS